MQVLFDEFPCPHQPKFIARLARTSYEGTKKWLQRHEGTWVKRGGRGWYRARATLQLLRRIGLEPLQVHALQLVVKSPTRGLPPQLRGLGVERQTADGQLQRVAEWRGRRVTIQDHRDGALVSIRASKDPVAIAEFQELSAWLQGLCAPGAVRVENCDLNVDAASHRLRVGGAESMSLGGFAAGLLKIYSKQVIDATRIEACFHRLDLDLPEVARILNEIATPPNVPPEMPPDDPREIT